MRVALIAPSPGPRTGSRTYAEVVPRVLAPSHEVLSLNEMPRLPPRADVVHVLDAKSALGSLPAFERLNLPLVVDLHDDYWTGRPAYPAFDRPARTLLWRRQRPRFQALLRRADAVVVHARHLREAVPHDRTVTVPIPALPPDGFIPDPKEFTSGPPSTQTRVLFAGRDALRKGLPVLGAALRRLRSESLDVAAFVAGGDWFHLRAAARWWMRGVPTRFLGDLPAEAMTRAYAEAHLVAVPSYTEAFGLVAQEALLHHLPVVASRVGGLEEILSPVRIEGPTQPKTSGGLLVPPGDVRALAAGIGEIAANRIEWRERARAAANDLAALRTGPAAAAALESAYDMAMNHRGEAS